MEYKVNVVYRITFRLFKEKALQLLDECYRTDEAKTKDLITISFDKQTDQFRGLDYLSVAAAHSNLEFVSHGSVQGVLDDIWSGKGPSPNYRLFSNVCFLNNV